MLFGIFDFIYSLISTFLQTILLPFWMVGRFGYWLYRLIFFFQYQLSDRCVDIFGQNYGCHIVNPSYVFTTLLKDLLFLSVIGYLLLQLKFLYDEWSAENLVPEEPAGNE